MASQTFEAQRGISSVEMADGFALIQVFGLPQAGFLERRIECLDHLAANGVSFDFLRLSTDGFSFVVPNRDAAKVESPLNELGVRFEQLAKQSLVTVSVPNLREENGLLAKIIEIVAATGVQVNSIGDTHTSVLILLAAADAVIVSDMLRSRVGAKDLLS